MRGRPQEAGEVPSQSLARRTAPRAQLSSESRKQYQKTALVSQPQVFKPETQPNGPFVLRFEGPTASNSEPDRAGQIDASFRGPVLGPQLTFHKIPQYGFLAAVAEPCFLSNPGIPFCVGPPPTLACCPLSQLPFNNQQAFFAGPMPMFQNNGYRLFAVSQSREASFEAPPPPLAPSSHQQPPVHSRATRALRKPSALPLLSSESETGAHLSESTEPLKNDCDSEDSAGNARLECLQEPKFLSLRNALQITLLTDSVSFDVLVTLNPFQRLCFEFLLCRKYAPNRLQSWGQTGGRLTDGESDSLLRALVNDKAGKRPEECYKFILNRVLKHLKRQFEGDFESSESAENKLYETYFGAVGRALNVSLDSFKYPLTRSGRGAFPLNTVYFERLFRSGEFLKAVFEYLNKRLIAEHSKEIERKIDALIDDWAELLTFCQSSEPSTQRQIVKQMAESGRCKMPWTLNEVKHAVRKFKSLVFRLRPKGQSQ